MVEECAVNVGFHSYFGRFRQSGDSETPLRLTIINEFRSTQPTNYFPIRPHGTPLECGELVHPRAIDIALRWSAESWCTSGSIDIALLWSAESWCISRAIDMALRWSAGL